MSSLVASFFPVLLFSLFLLSGATRAEEPTPPAGGATLAPELSLQVPGLRPCTGAPGDTIHIDPTLPVIIMTHGCLDSTARFQALAEVFAFHGQQAICFTYDDRDSLVKSSGELASAIEELERHVDAEEITVIGHSMGGLIARKALVADRPGGLGDGGPTLRLVTVSSPFAGIYSAWYCGSPVAYTLSLGLIIPVCLAISGDKWYEITYASDFIREPGMLSDRVGGHIKIVTDERGTCRRYDDGGGSCVEDDFVFTLDEQYHDPVDSAELVSNIEVAAGHVEIVGDADTAPVKLIRVLQATGVMKKTEAWREKELQELLSRIY